MDSRGGDHRASRKERDDGRAKSGKSETDQTYTRMNKRQRRRSGGSFLTAGEDGEEKRSRRRWWTSAQDDIPRRARRRRRNRVNEVAVGGERH